MALVSVVPFQTTQETSSFQVRYTKEISKRQSRDRDRDRERERGRDRDRDIDTYARRDRGGWSS